MERQPHELARQAPPRGASLSALDPQWNRCRRAQLRAWRARFL